MRSEVERGIGGQDPPTSLSKGSDMEATRLIPRIVEFFGLPGTGKTTIANQCIAIARSCGRSVYSSDDIKGRFLSSGIVRRAGRIAAGGALAWWPIYLALRAPPFRQLRSEGCIRYRLRSAFNAPVYFLPLRGLECEANPAIVLLDEWITQKIWATSLFGNCEPSAAAELIRRFVTHFEVQYVILELDPRIAAERAYDRALRRKEGLEDHRHPIFDHMQKTDLLDTYRKGHDVFLDICESIEYYTKNSIRIDGRQPAEETSRIVADVLLRPYATCVPPTNSFSDAKNRLSASREWGQSP